MIHRLCLAGALALASATGASAQAMKCSAFLHNRDGSWTSFFTGTVNGVHGPIPVATGERFVPGRGAKAEVAAALDALCQPE